MCVCVWEGIGVRFHIKAISAVIFIRFARRLQEFYAKDLRVIVEIEIKKLCLQYFYLKPKP